MTPIKNILVPTDFSAGALAALRYAMDLARSTGASITLLNVYQPPNWLLPDGSAVIAQASTLARIETMTSEALESLREQFAHDEVSLRTLSLIGKAEAEIVRFAREGGYDLIVMGTHGRTGLKHLFLGSVAERVVRFASCPVLTVHEEQGQETRAAPSEPL